MKLVKAFMLIAIFFIFGSCGSSGRPPQDLNAPDRDTTPQVLNVEAPGVDTFTGNGATVDYSNAKNGYIMAKYVGDNKKIKLQITKRASKDTYTYDINPGENFTAFPISQGAGEYNIAVFTNISGDKYSQAAAQEIQVVISDEFQPFLRPSQYVNYNSATQAVAKAQQLVTGTKDDIGAVYAIYDYITKNIVYDKIKAATVQSGYLPDVDETLSSGKGICFDYAALMATMLRTQKIPCELIVGYAGKAYHAWIAAHVGENGDVINVRFDGEKWTLMDPTFLAGGDKTDPNQVGDGTNYDPVYYY